MKSGSAKDRRLHDKSIDNGLNFCKYHIDEYGKTREEVMALIGGMYDFVIKLREWEAESDRKDEGGAFACLPIGAAFEPWDDDEDDGRRDGRVVECTHTHMGDATY